MYQCNCCGDKDEDHFYQGRRLICRECYNAERRAARMSKPMNNKQQTSGDILQVLQPQPQPPQSIVEADGIAALSVILAKLEDLQAQTHLALIRLSNEMAMLRHEIVSSTFDETSRAFQEEISLRPLDPVWNQIGSRRLETPEDITHEIICAEHYVSALKKQLLK